MNKKKKPPVLNKWQDREGSVLEDIPSIIVMERNPKAIERDLWSEARTFDKRGGA